MDLKKYFSEIKKEDYSSSFSRMALFLEQRRITVNHAPVHNGGVLSWLRINGFELAITCVLLLAFATYVNYRDFSPQKSYVISFEVEKDSAIAHRAVRSIPGMDTMELKVAKIENEAVPSTRFEVKLPRTRSRDALAWIRNVQSIEGVRAFAASAEAP